MTVTCVIPARDEHDTVKDVVASVSRSPHVSEVIVVDNGSSDGTADLARAAGAIVVSEPRQGLGYAVARGFKAARTPLVLKTDADIRNFKTRWIDDRKRSAVPPGSRQLSVL